MQALLTIENLKKSYGRTGNRTRALDGLSFNVLNGEFLGIMGSSGSGKTTLLNCIATVIRPDEGRIILDGVDILSLKEGRLSDYRGKTIGYLFQNFELLDNLTARENILLPCALHGGMDSSVDAQLKALVAQFEIGDVLDKFPAQLSGGQKQRVAAARALMLSPKLILADEPTGALDSRSSDRLLSCLAELNRTLEATIMMVTHDAHAASFCRRILFIRDGKIFHEIRRDVPAETQQAFYERILRMLAQLTGGTHVH